MTQHAFLYILYVLIVVPAMGIAGMSALALWAWRRSNGNSRQVTGIAILFASIFAHRLFTILFAGGFGYIVKPVPTTLHTWTFWIGEAILAAGLWNAARAFFGKRAREAKQTERAMSHEDARVLELQQAADERISYLDAYHEARVRRRDVRIHYLVNQINQAHLAAATAGIHLPPISSWGDEDPPLLESAKPEPEGR